MPDAHTAVVHELIVRYLDAWTARALHGGRGVAYAQSGGGTDSPAPAVVRVFSEFADRLRGQRLTVLVACPDGDVEGVRAGLSATAADAGLAPDVMSLVVAAGSSLVPLEGVERAAVFAYVDRRGVSADADATLAALAAHRGLEVLVRGPAADLSGWPWHAAVELVGRDGVAETVGFGAGDERALGVFKGELWALDEYAGIRFRDPGDPERTLVDISLRPPLGPLRRAVCAHLAGGARTLAQLRAHALAATIYRADDVARAVTELEQGGTVLREPPGGRLTPATVVRLAA
jgi:hypothetical protein